MFPDTVLLVTETVPAPEKIPPPAASTPLQAFVGTEDYTEIPFKGGHIGIYVSGSALDSILHQTAPAT